MINHGEEKTKQKPQNLLAQNKKARHDYNILSTYEAGIALTGTEIKSVRAGKINLRDGFAQVKHGQVWLENVHISPYEQEINLTLIPGGIVSYFCIRKKFLN